MRDRRTSQGHKLRVYLDAITEVKLKTDQQWLNEWIQYGDGMPYMSKSLWLSYLEQCAIKEAEYFMRRSVA